jgi:pyridoxine/pyridoxamine 5'-phosphate oxidase
MANLCTVAAATASTTPEAKSDPQTPNLRTLVLRDVGEQLALFINATSPKWSSFAAGPVSLVTYWPSISIQYRLQMHTHPLDAKLVHDSWLLRPDPPKHMDWYYEKFAGQSTPVADRATLLRNLENLELDEPLAAPSSARGLLLEPVYVERLDLSMDNGVHDRSRAYLTDDGWQTGTLVP